MQYKILNESFIKEQKLITCMKNLFQLYFSDDVYGITNTIDISEIISLVQETSLKIDF